MTTAQKITEVWRELDALLETLWRTPVHDLPEGLVDNIKDHTSRLRLISQALLSPETRDKEPIDPPQYRHDRGLGELVSVLHDQVKAKDEQLKAKDEQIASLQRQSEDLVTAIRHWQARALPPPRNGASWWRRLWPRGGAFEPYP